MPSTTYKPTMITAETHDILLRLKFETKKPMIRLIAEAVERMQDEHDVTKSTRQA